jgi:hypothetical protein
MSEFVHPENADNPNGLQLPRGNDYVNIFKRFFIEQYARRIMKQQLSALPACKDEAGNVPEPSDLAAWRQWRRNTMPAVELLLDPDAKPKVSEPLPPYGSYADRRGDTTNDHSVRFSGFFVKAGLGIMLVGTVGIGGYAVANAGKPSEEVDPQPTIEMPADGITNSLPPTPSAPADTGMLPGPADYTLPSTWDR